MHMHGSLAHAKPPPKLTTLSEAVNSRVVTCSRRRICLSIAVLACSLSAPMLLCAADPSHMYRCMHGSFAHAKQPPKLTTSREAVNPHIVSRSSFLVISSLFPCHGIAELATSAVMHLQVHACKRSCKISWPYAAVPVLPLAADMPCVRPLLLPHLLLLFIAPIATTTTIAIATTIATTTCYSRLLLPLLLDH